MASEPPVVTAIFGRCPSDCVARQAGQVHVGDRVVDAGRDRGDRDLAPPLADLHDQRDVGPRGHAGQMKRALGVRERRRDRVTRDRRAALVARDRLRNGVQRAVGHVNGDVVERHLPGRVVDHARQRSGRRARAGGHLALQPAAAGAGAARADVGGATGAAGHAVGAGAAIQHAAAAVADGAAVLAAGRRARDRSAVGIHTQVRGTARAAGHATRARAAIQRAAAAVADLAAVESAGFGVARQRHATGRRADAGVALTCARAAAAAERAAAAVADGAAVVAAGDGRTARAAHADAVRAGVSAGAVGALQRAAGTSVADRAAVGSARLRAGGDGGDARGVGARVAAAGRAAGGRTSCARGRRSAGACHHRHATSAGSAAPRAAGLLDAGAGRGGQNDPQEGPPRS